MNALLSKPSIPHDHDGNKHQIKGSILETEGIRKTFDLSPWIWYNIDSMNKAEKYKNVLEKGKKTREKHKGMLCRTYELKLKTTNRRSKELLERTFREANYLWNACVELGPDAIDYREKSMFVFCGDHYEIRPLKLGCQMRQAVIQSFWDALKALSSKKSKGQKVGRIRYRGYTNCLPLQQYGITYTLDFEKNTVRIQNMGKDFKVFGLKQIPKEADITNAKLLKKPGGYYLRVTTFVPKKTRKTNGKECGIDFGIETNFTLDNGEKFDISVPESKGVKLAQKRLSKKKKGSKNRAKERKKLQRAYEKDRNRRLDKAKKLVHYLSQFDMVAIQDENLQGWKKRFGKTVQHSAMGYVKEALKRNEQTIVVDQHFPSTQLCPVCGKLTKQPLSKRDYDCKYCGFHHPDRDVKAAETILLKARSLRNREPHSPVELKTPEKDSQSCLFQV